MAEIRRENHLGWCWNPINNGINYQPQLVSLPDFSHQQYVQDGSRREVNLIPNAQIEDQLFNQLADKKVDVDAWLHPTI